MQQIIAGGEGRAFEARTPGEGKKSNAPRQAGAREALGLSRMAIGDSARCRFLSARFSAPLPGRDNIAARTRGLRAAKPAALTPGYDSRRRSAAP